MSSEPFVVRCPNCSTPNGVSEGRVGFRPMCGVCGTPLPVLASFEPAPAAPPSRARPDTALRWTLAALAFLAGLSAYVIHAALNSSSQQQIAQTRPLPVVENALDNVGSIPPRNAPANQFSDLIPSPRRLENPSFQPPKATPVPFRPGILTVRGGGDRIAPLKITSPPGSERYYVKLTRGGAKGPEYMTLLIAPGTTYETKVAVGTYWMKYATGQDWYGPQERFGPATRYFEAKSDLSFWVEEDIIHGQTVVLIKQAGGNLQTASILQAEF
jgi:hypothetical protein